MKEEFDGEIDGIRVKTIVKFTENCKQWLAKPKNRDIETPHFKEKESVLEVHQDSPDNSKYRTMNNISSIGSVSLPSGLIFLPMQKDIAVLPMTADNDKYVIKNTISGVNIYLNFSGDYVLVALGEWG